LSNLGIVYGEMISQVTEPTPVDESTGQLSGTAASSTIGATFDENMLPSDALGQPHSARQLRKSKTSCY